MHVQKDRAETLSAKIQHCTQLPDIDTDVPDPYFPCAVQLVSPLTPYSRGPAYLCSMKKTVLRAVVAALILTVAIAFLVVFWTMRREVPAQARVIPSDAFAVLTLNLRELTADHSGDAHLFPEMADQSMMQKELAPFQRAVLENGSTGIDELSDVLMFTYHSGEAAFFGIALELSDSAEFGQLMRVQVKKEYNIIPWTNDGIPVVRFDTSAAVFGWTEDVALFLYPLGNHGIATVSTQCIKLLKQQKENSVLANESFREMEMNSFAMSLWVQTKPFRNFTGGGELVDQVTNNIEYFNYMADFEDGEILIRSEWYLQDDVVKDNIKEFAFPCDPQLMTGFIRTHLDVENDSLFEEDIKSNVFDRMPISDDDCKQLLPFLTGDCIFIAHDSVMKTSIQSLQSVNGTTIDTTHYAVYPETYCFHLEEPVKANALITSLMKRDSIPLTSRGWEYDVAGVKGWRMLINDDLLTLTNHDEVDGRTHAITAELAGYMAWFDLHKIFASQDGSLFSLLMPRFSDAHTLLADNLVTCHSTLPVQFRSVRRSEIKITFKNQEVNGLVQAEELLRKIYFSE